MVLFLCFLLACDTEVQDRERVLAGIDRLQAAPAKDYGARKGLANDLLAMQVKSPAAIRARDACANAYLKLAESNELSEGIEKELSDTSKKSDPLDLAKRLERSDTLLQEAEGLLETCKVAKGDVIAKSPQ
ncbi:MAG: hypothetical protein HOV80_17520 [Polyangiaceae bacterium]|nr:hypothetical protein [Polyangiaceae bacterium]